MSVEDNLIFHGYKNTVKFDLNNFMHAEVITWLGVSITCDVINAGWICNATLTPIG